MTGPDDGRPLRVHFYASLAHPQGTYFRFHNLAVGLTRLGHRVTVYAADHNFRSHSRWETRDGVRYHVLAESQFVRLFGHNCDLLTVLRRAARQSPACDVAHLFQPFPSAAAAWLRADARVRFYDWDDLWTGGLMRGPVHRWRDLWPRWCVRYLEPRLPRWADRVTVVGGFLADRARQAGARDVSVIYNGVWPVAYLDRVEARRQLGLQSGALYAGFMGRTADELPWCFDALAENRDRHPALRLAVCGAPEQLLQDLPPAVRERVDYLGQLTPEQTRAFAAALDLGLLPLADNPFNLSRFPIKFSEHLATGVPLLCSTVGETGRLAPLFPWAIPAGTTRAEWVRAFGEAVERVARGDAPRADTRLFGEHLSWDGLSRRLADSYRSALAATHD
ncbi:MAG TPA: glycosyltransferase [Fimbriiglobus sp.]|nr:glycosyltransferase [Fimbriiglobus sp.]